jgi:hypothetical protein
MSEILTVSHRHFSFSSTPLPAKHLNESDSQKRSSGAMSETFTVSDRRSLQAGSAHPCKRLNQTAIHPRLSGVADKEIGKPVTGF